MIAKMTSNLLWRSAEIVCSVVCVCVCRACVCNEYAYTCSAFVLHVHVCGHMHSLYIVSLFGYFSLRDALIKITVVLFCQM